MEKPNPASPGGAARRRKTKTPAPKVETSTDDAAAADNAKPNAHWRGVFLAALAETSNVTAAAAAAAVPPSRPYKVRREEPEFARLWYAALLEGYENLEMEVLQRLRFGEGKDDAVRFDNAAALRLLGLHRETVARERALREDEDVAAVRASIDAKLEHLRLQVEARRLAAANPDGDPADG
ncbi:hypothetical protein [Novosphingobium sp. 9]|uniref:hypothetical protein n=1 Tax=Novosphingobium sp. 9 TaxID=2025349 RepID=UPI0021B58FFD|nr:hypothetical protein [Novosphingobium sp. 9]